MQRSIRLLQIGESDRKDIRKLIQYAQEHTLTLAMLRLSMYGENGSSPELPPVGDNPEHVVHLHDGYRVVFSYEEQPVGLCAHMSISIESGHAPHPAAVETIMEEFGMGKNLRDCLQVWIEGNSVNLLKLVGDCNVA